MSYSSVKLFVFIFRLFDLLIIDPRPYFTIDIVSTVCPRMLSLAAYDVSTQQFSTFTPPARRTSGNLIVCFSYLGSLLSFFQLSSSGFLTLVVRKDITVCA